MVTAVARREDPEPANLLASARGIFVRRLDLCRLNFADLYGRFVRLGDDLQETSVGFLEVRERDEQQKM